jgi:prepilin-type N-terminal cleavage/methylation domain-containing protein
MESRKLLRQYLELFGVLSTVSQNSVTKSNTMKYCTLYGFTLVELIAVLSIIAMLLGLLMPAIKYPHRGGRRVECLNKQSQIALGIISYESTHGTFPGWRQTLANGHEVSWTVMLLPYLEYNQVWQKLQAESLNEKEMAEISSCSIKGLQCRSSDIKSGESLISYIVNCGKMDAEFAAVSPANPTGHLADKEQKNGVFFDHVETETKITSDFISKQNGTSYTILLSETLQAGNWNEKPRENLVGFCYPDPSFLNQQRDICMGTNAPVVPVFVNHCRQGDLTIEHGRINELGEYRFARPASNHPGTVNVSFCDRSTRTINENIDPKIFQRLMFSSEEPIDPKKIE